MQTNNSSPQIGVCDSEGAFIVNAEAGDHNKEHKGNFCIYICSQSRINLK